jgi:anaerobic selenocysteine-containing dehydrogenase
MSVQPKPSFIEKIAEGLGVIPKLDLEDGNLTSMNDPGDLSNYPPPEKWDDWVEYESTTWSRKKARHYTIVPTSCFNCESGCGLLSYVDKETGEVRKFEGNPYHPASRGRNCAKGPATINQIKDPDRILYPMRRVGKRGAGEWERVSWDVVLDEIAAKIRKAIDEGRNNEIAYHVGRPGHEGFMDRVLQAWGVDGHNSHTNVCSAGARTGYALWDGIDRKLPDFANADFILMISAHLESGHYFNPHAQRIIESKNSGTKIAVMDIRLSNTASRADHWMATYPGTEAAVLLAMAKIILDENLYNETYLRNWINWSDWLEADHPETESSFENFIQKLREEYAEYTPEFAEEESGVEAQSIIDVARQIGRAGSRFSSMNWRSASSGNLGGWQIARCLQFLNVLTGSLGTKGGSLPSSWNKYSPKMPNPAPPHKFWNELHFPKDFPLAHFEMSFLLPHFLKEGRGKLDVYFTRVFNPVWTYPDGFTWIEALRDPEKIGLHAALTPTWNETAYFADYVLPMGHASERHDIISYETHAGKWIAFRQPVLREVARRKGEPVEFTYEANPGEVWEEDEFWIELSWRIDPDGSLGIRDYFISPYRPGEKMTVDEYYQYIFERVPGLPETAEKEGLTPLDYMRRFGAFEMEKEVLELHNKTLTEEQLSGSSVNEKSGIVTKDGAAIGVMVEGEARVGFDSPSRKQEFFSQTMVDWKWPEHRLPGYIKSHIHAEKVESEKGEFPLVPTFRLPTLIHSRSGNAKWLAEISNRNPLWMHTSDANRLGFKNDDLLRVNTEIGHFIVKVWVTESMRPGVVACSHHIGRWRRPQDPEANRWATNSVDILETEPGKWKMNVLDGIRAFDGEDPDMSRIFWRDGGVHQNITHAVHPDPISGMHCWHQKVRLEKAHPGDRYGDLFVDTEQLFQVYKDWLENTRPAPGPDGLRRPLWFKRPLKPIKEKFYLK